MRKIWGFLYAIEGVAFLLTAALFLMKGGVRGIDSALFLGTCGTILFLCVPSAFVLGRCWVIVLPIVSAPLLLLQAFGPLPQWAEYSFHIGLGGTVYGCIMIASYRDNKHPAVPRQADALACGVGFVISAIVALLVTTQFFRGSNHRITTLVFAILAPMSIGAYLGHRSLQGSPPRQPIMDSPEKKRRSSRR